MNLDWRGQSRKASKKAVNQVTRHSVRLQLLRPLQNVLVLEKQPDSDERDHFLRLHEPQKCEARAVPAPQARDEDGSVEDHTHGTACNIP